METHVCKALLVGNSTFPEDPHNLPDLKGPINDLPLLFDALTDAELGVFEQRHIRLLPERTKREITTAMEQFFRGAGRDDTLVLYYSGHGQQDEDDNLFLCARDTRTDLLVSTAISDIEINGMMRLSSAQTFVVILDCCHSGAFKGGGLPGNLRGTGRFLITSSRRGQLSSDAPDESGPSAFTRYLVEAMRLGTLDGNGDGYVSLNDIYDYVLTRLQDDTRQIPQRHFDNAVGDVALARALPGVAQEVASVAVEPSSHEQPILELSDSEIEIRNVQPDEDLPEEIIDVYNRGGGELVWTVETDADWISVRPEAGYLALKFRPKPGINRGHVKVRAPGAGGTKTIRVLVHVTAPEPPRLRISPDFLDFGTLSRGVRSPSRSVQLLNAGGGSLDARAHATEPWIQLHRSGDTIGVTVNTATMGELRGEIVVESAGGGATVEVRVLVEPGPLLAVSPLAVDFGTIASGRSFSRPIHISNVGGGQLQWEYGVSGDALEAVPTQDGLLVTVRAHSLRRLLGSIWIRSNGGQATVDVRAVVASGAQAPGQGHRVDTVTRPYVRPPVSRERSRGMFVASLVLAAFVLAGAGAAGWQWLSDLTNAYGAPEPVAHLVLAVHQFPARSEYRCSDSVESGRIQEVILDWNSPTRVSIVNDHGVSDKGKTIYPGTPLLLVVSNGPCR